MSRPATLRRPGARVLDAALVLIVCLALAWLALRLDRLDYRWNWGVLAQAFWREGSATPGPLLQGLFTTVRLSLWSGLLALVLGTLMALARVSPRPFRRMVGTTYVEVVRNLPPLVLVFLGYFFLGSQLAAALDLQERVLALPPWAQDTLSWVLGPPGQFPELLSAVLVLGLLEGAYITEIVRAGIRSLAPEQWEASCALGLTRGQQLRHVILPQAMTRMLPALAGQFISTVKDTAIVSVISVREATFQATELSAATYRTFEIWITVLALYLVLSGTCSLAARRLEARLARREAAGVRNGPL
ncbi:amino acid ABC transporter permease [Desulfovibrio aminophilus]|nr:amino acid ABC transporter permease [Desulfovibrio aminophilus]MCM0754493.1 amino acid ABC transporter permease [Desulfovibrio aminophilus]